MFGTIVSIMGTIFSFIGMGFTLTGKSNAAKCQFYKNRGLDLKESKQQLAKAMRYYKKALEYAETNEQRAEIWGYIIHIHTDRTIGASQEWTDCTGQIPEWNWGPNRIPSKL